MDLHTKITFLQGFLLGSYAHALALRYNSNDTGAFAGLIKNVPIMQLIVEVDGWYLQTHSFSTPIYLVIYARGKVQ